MVFPVVEYGHESWTIKKAERQRTDVFELWGWRRFLRFPWTARRSNQSFLKEISLEYLLDGLMLKLKLQYFDHLIWRTDSLEKTLMLRQTEGGRRRGRQKMRWLDDREAWLAAVHGVTKSRTQLSNWTELNKPHWSVLSYKTPDLTQKHKEAEREALHPTDVSGPGCKYKQCP